MIEQALADLEYFPDWLLEENLRRMLREVLTDNELEHIDVMQEAGIDIFGTPILVKITGGSINELQ